MNELAAAINNMPETYERLSNNQEWSEKRWTHYRDLTGGLAYWAVHQFAGSDVGKNYNQDKNPPYFAPGLENVIGYLSACIRPQFNDCGFKEMSLCDVNKMLWEVLRDCEIFKSWNTEEVCGKAWLDLSALLHNICLTIRNDRRKNDAFDAEFEKQWTEKNSG